MRRDIYLVTMPVFGVKKALEGDYKGKDIISHCAVINVAEKLPSGKYRMETKKGISNDHIFDSHYIKLYKIEDICLTTLMRDWSRINNSSLPIVLDESIDTNEVYEGNNYCTLKIMVERRKNEIAIKPQYEMP